MKKLIILITCLATLFPATSSGKDQVKKTKQLHSKETINYVDANISNTLNVLKSTKTDEQQPEIYNPMNLHFEQPKISVKDRKARKKSLFLKERRTRKLQRKVKKLNFFSERRKNKIDRNPYLLTWIHILNSKGEI
tara:strand:+ start:553 stop:960 length:408 start_codon:yes stop_codon:yes gene_type:complete